MVHLMVEMKEKRMVAGMESLMAAKWDQRLGNHWVATLVVWKAVEMVDSLVAFEAEHWVALKVSL